MSSEFQVGGWVVLRAWQWVHRDPKANKFLDSNKGKPLCVTKNSGNGHVYVDGCDAAFYTERFRLVSQLTAAVLEAREKVIE
jgi:hypothetical protein